MFVQVKTALCSLVNKCILLYIRLGCGSFCVKRPEMAAAQSSGQTAGGLDLGPGNQEQESAGPGWADGNSLTLGSRVSV